MTQRSAFRLTVIVCAHNEAHFISPCLHSLLAQTRVPDEIVVVNNASTDETRAVAQQIPYVHVVDEPRKGLVVARETGRRAATGDILVYLDADCRAPLNWLERVERRFLRTPGLIGLSSPYRYYDWDWWGRLLIRAYDFTLAPATQLLVKYILRMGTDLVDVWEAANRDDLFSVTSLKHYPYIANSDFHKPKHLYSWKTLVRSEKSWPAIARALRNNVDVAITLFRNGSWSPAT
ncbi:MAG TPA: glycosyltransferase [Vicinamibacterales bacterium]|nr:glycosyltransferase [Vicinamibacterales bacterium]